MNIDKFNLEELYHVTDVDGIEAIVKIVEIDIKENYYTSKVGKKNLKLSDIVIDFQIIRYLKLPENYPFKKIPEGTILGIRPRKMKTKFPDFRELNSTEKILYKK